MSETTQTNNLLSVGEVAELCGVSTETVRKWMLAGVLEYIEVGPNFTRRVYRRDAERMIQPPTKPPSAA